ncbi:MAG: O-succinylhomoserine sulfhydrylase [Acidimicrobiia bacterium]|nr:O-succinylhomoserine sulfhydrylase [Acidimicrobiia bacterium]MBT8193011.1 O-succinylhomoserine sulfhydrylase [Acidimicrobiia bacterium]MBT8247041.1 O-succinylhomoserine sulfhydrylase [Acidimicrobiia bacterium]NNF88677.1 O-succinylhomoserine sulfhydrylase [Acidimicrobiia bacterium]NNL13358.1 O-succinylhomoserine sulfhydrylase [Acidimicrobiia bacterium]
MKENTELVRGGLTRSGFDETAEALFLTSGYVYESAEQAESTFAGDVDHYIYSRYGNPTVSMFEERLRLLEGSEDAWSTASGMAAVFWSLAALLEQGDRVVASRDLFGSCFVILDELLPRWGIRTEFVNGASLDEWEQALATPAAAVFFESPSNPMQGLVDVAAVSELAHAAGAMVVVDNVFATPILQKPLTLGADIVVYSTTKHIDGQGRTMGGAILGSSEYIQEQLKPFMRHTGPTLSPFNAWVLVKSLETLTLRVAHQTGSALRLAEVLETTARVNRVWYPGLASHPQAALAERQMSGGGTVVTFEVEGGKEGAFQVLNGTSIIDISNNLGDSKSLLTHPATTTHRRIGPEARAAVGITDGVIRLSVGLEDVDDLLEDLTGSLEQR